MGKEPSDQPHPEVLQTQQEPDGEQAEAAPQAMRSDNAQLPVETAAHIARARARRGSFRPSHKATFIGVGVVVAILAINAGIIGWLVNSQGQAAQNALQDEVVISTDALNQLGVSRNPVTNAGTELIVGPNSRFNGTVKIGQDVSIGGQLKLNSKFIATDASLARLEAGETSLGQLNVNGDGTVTTLNMRKDLNVAGATRLQGPVNIAQLLTVSNSVNVTGNLSVGGALSVNQLAVNSLSIGSTLTIGGHVITRGSAPGVSPGPAIGSNGTVSISGNDTSGTVAVNTGVGAGGGIVATIDFRTNYGATPRVIVTPVGGGVSDVYVNRSANGFSIGVGGISLGGHAFDYIVMQ